MNDDFLHQLRAAPSPQFVAALKGRLDRQPHRPAVARASLPITLGVALLLGVATFALAIILSPELRELLQSSHAPQQLTARAPASTGSTHRPVSPPQHLRLPARPLAAAEEPPALLTGEVSGATAAEPRAPDDSDVQTISIITAPELESVTRAAAEQFARGGRHPEPVFTEAPASLALARFCGPSASIRPNLISTSRRMRASEYQSCRRNGSGELSESRMPFRTETGTLTLYLYVRQGGAVPAGYPDFLRAYWLALIGEAERPAPPAQAPPDSYFFEDVRPQDLQP